MDPVKNTALKQLRAYNESHFTSRRPSSNSKLAKTTAKMERKSGKFNQTIIITQKQLASQRSASYLEQFKSVKQDKLNQHNQINADQQQNKQATDNVSKTR